MAFQEYGVSTGGKYVGFENFAKVFFDQDFWLSILRSIYFSFLYITLVFFSSNHSGYFIIRDSNRKKFLQGNLLFTCCDSGIIVMLMWEKFF